MTEDVHARFMADVHRLLAERLPDERIEVYDATQLEAWNPMNGPEPAWIKDTFVLGVRIGDWDYRQRFTDALLQDAIQNIGAFTVMMIERKKAGG